MSSQTLSTIISTMLGDDLFRTDLTAEATRALQTAIKHYEREIWWFQEQRANASTVADQEYYALPSDFGSLDSLVIDVGGSTSNKYPLFQRTQEQIDRWQQGGTGTSGRPTDFALYDRQLRLWVIPDDAYSLTLSYRANNLSDSTTAAASNIWTNIADELIRWRADSIVAFSVLQDAQRAAGFKVQEKEAYDALRSEHNRRVTTGHTRKRR